MNDPILGPATVGGRSSSVSLVVQHAVRPEATERYETWLSQISAKNAEYPGHQGVHIIRPGPGNRTYTVVVRFATFEDASRWAGSADRKALVAQIADALEQGDSVAIHKGIEFWFSPPAGASHEAKPWKQWLLTTAVIWPLTMIVPAVVKPLFDSVPGLAVFGISHLITTTIICALVTWLLMPFAVKAVSRWLFG